MSHSRKDPFQLRTTVAASLVTMLSLYSGLAAASVSADNNTSKNRTKTASPIKHVIVLIGENRTFDNVYGTYVPKRGQSVSNLLSQKIVDVDGQPGPNKDLAKQYEINGINPASYFISAKGMTKVAYSPFLPTPETNYAPPQPITLNQLKNDAANAFPPFDAKTFTADQLHKIAPGIAQSDVELLTTGATGLKNCTADSSKAPSGCPGPDTRVMNYASLPNTVFQITGPTLPYDAYTGDMVHRFFHMWQQSDCDIANASKTDPAGCKNDLYAYVGVARGDDSGSNAMGFYNIQKGDAPIFKQLADEYTMSDNFHQSVMGGTAVQHIMLGYGDQLYWESVANLPAQPPANRVANPNPKSATNDAYTVDERWTQCGDASSKPIMDYLKSLPWHPDQTASNCENGRFYMVNNARPAYFSNGKLNEAGIKAGKVAPPSSLRTLGDALNSKNISWAYYGGGFDAAARFDSGSTDPVDVMIATDGNWYCDICNPFQYSANFPTYLKNGNIKDVNDFYATLDKGVLPAVSYVKPDSFVDGHPASSKLNQFEAMISNIHNKLKANPALFKETAFIVAFDEGGGYWDSGFFQPIDFFGDGPRIPFIVVSPHAKGGKVVHTYQDHASVLKFIERNWGLSPLTKRSRDNLPNPKGQKGNPYVPANMPAVGDLFDMFHFKK